MQVILLTHYMKKKNNMGICNYKAQNSFFRRKNMIHTSKDAQATAAICSCGPNPWKSKLRKATVGLSECWTLLFAVLCPHRSEILSAKQGASLLRDRPVSVQTSKWLDRVSPTSLACTHRCTRPPASRQLLTHLAGWRQRYLWRHFVLPWAFQNFPGALPLIREKSWC